MKQLSIASLLENKSELQESPLKVVKSLSGDFRELGKSLLFLKEDLDLYTYLLQTILEETTCEEIYSKARLFLEKQLESEKKLKKLIFEHRHLKKKLNVTSDTIHCEEMTRQFFQLKEEVANFTDNHYSVKLEYIRFTHEHTQSKSRQPFMVA